jgi:hypothetical protein
MVPPELRVKRTKKILALAPAGSSFCAGCQSFRDLEDFGKGATKCRPCSSATAHAAMVEKTYGITAAGYDALLRAQGGRCAICRARPKSKRLAVDHDHKTGAVRGLLCSRCNHDLLGSAWDSLALAAALWHYMNTPPATGRWAPPESAGTIGVIEDARKALAKPSADLELVTVLGQAKRPPAVSESTAAGVSVGRVVLPVGSAKVPGKTGVWRYYVEDESDAPF